jgi:RHS repeat-associated protein
LHERIEYTPYGELWIEHKYNSEEQSLPYRFTGKELDEETKLYYYGARYLDPRTSRWISGDPAMGEYIPGAPINDDVRKQNQNLPGGGGIYNIVNLHVFHYAGNNPLKYTDPDGRDDDDIVSHGVDINLFDPNTEVALYASKVSHPQDTFIVAGDGNSLYMTDKRDGDEHLVLPDDLVEMIKSHPNYKAGDTIVLLACNVGNADESGLDPFAQLVADKLGLNTVVKAADNYVQLDSNGFIFIGPNIDRKNAFFDSRFKFGGLNYKEMSTFIGRDLPNKR